MINVKISLKIIERYDLKKRNYIGTLVLNILMQKFSKFWRINVPHFQKLVMRRHQPRKIT